VRVEGAPEPVNWQERFESRGKNLPKVGQVWIRRGNNGGVLALKINSVNLESGTVQGQDLDINLKPLVDQDGRQVPETSVNLSNLLEGETLMGQDIALGWLGRFGKGDGVNLNEGNTRNERGDTLRDALGREIPQGEYEVVKVSKDDKEDSSQVILRPSSGNDIVASPTVLALFGIDRYNKPKVEGEKRVDKEILPPKANQRYKRKVGEAIPPEFADLPETFDIISVDIDRGEIDIRSEDGKTQDTLTLAQWRMLLGGEFYRRAGSARQEKKPATDSRNQRQGQNQQRGQRGQQRPPQPAPPAPEEENEEE
jgi:hypothetical protein